MKRIKLLTALAIGVVASSSGMIQVGAATYNFFVDFSTKEVANFTDFKQSYSIDTYNLDSYIEMYWAGTYSFDSCPTAFSVDMDWRTEYRLNGTGLYTLINVLPLPNLTCSTIDLPYVASGVFLLPTIIIDAIINDDTNFVEFRSQMRFVGNANRIGRTLTLKNYANTFDITYDFGTTYLFNYFLSDHSFVSRGTSGTGVFTFNIPQETNLRYVYTTAGNDTYIIINTNTSNIGTTRKKYAIDYNDEFFRGNSVGAGVWNSYIIGSDTIFFPTSGTSFLNYSYNYHFLNTANLAQAIVDAPIIGFTEEVCSGGFLDINVGCYVNNALAYIVNDAPVISDAFTLLNTGIELAAQTFGIIGNFSDDNVFGYLILVGFGFIAVKWFLKNDE